MSFITSLFPGRKAGPTTSSAGSLSNWLPLDLRASGGTAYSGVQVNEQMALTISAVYRSVSLISDAVSMLPIAVLQKKGDKRIVVEGHPVDHLLNRKPNDLMTSVNLRTAIQAHALQYGSGYLDVQRTVGGDLLALWPLLPDRTHLTNVNLADDSRAVKYVTTVEGEQVAIDPENVVHILGLSYDGLRGYSPLQLFREGLGLAKALEEFGSKFFGNDAKSGGFVEHPAKLSPEAHKRLADSLSEQGGINNAHRIKILEEGMKFNAISISPEDSQFLMTRTFQVEEIARLYGIPLHMLQSHAKSTSWGSGIAQMSLGFLIYTLAPWLTRWEQELSGKLLTEEEIQQGYYVRHNVNALLRSDPQTRASYYTAALNKTTGWMERNEVRALEDLNPDEIENEVPITSFGPPQRQEEEEEPQNKDPEGPEDPEDPEEG